MDALGESMGPAIIFAILLGFAFVVVFAATRKMIWMIVTVAVVLAVIGIGWYLETSIVTEREVIVQVANDDFFCGIHDR